MYSRESRCWLTGVPVYLNNPAQPTFFLQSPKQVTMIFAGDAQVRRVYLDVPHSETPKPSWYSQPKLVMPRGSPASAAFWYHWRAWA